MGLFDTVKLADGTEAQVKCWDSRLRVYTAGAAVPRVEGQSNYSILLPNETYIWVRVGKVMPNAMDSPGGARLVINKWGDVLYRSSSMHTSHEEVMKAAKEKRTANEFFSTVTTPEGEPALDEETRAALDSEPNLWQDDTGQKLIRVHDRNKDCDVYHCPIHNPSSHAKSIGTTYYNFPQGRMERVCVHGHAHPDPDAQAWRQRKFGTKNLDHKCCPERCCEVQLPGPTNEQEAA